MQTKRRQFLLAVLISSFVVIAAVTVSALAKPAGKPIPKPGRESGKQTVLTKQLPQEVVLPWEDAPDFKQARADAGTPIRMAVYSAVMVDPLPGEWYNITHAANQLAGTVIPPGEVYSMNRALGPYTLAKGYQKGPTYSGGVIITTIGGGVCKIASLLYNIATLGNMEIVERHNHSLTVPYVPPGQDATVFYGSRDIKFRNTTRGPILVWAKTKDNKLYMALYGSEKPPQINWHHETLKILKTRTVVQYNPKLPVGTQRVSAPGQDGIIVRTWLTVKLPDGKEETRQLGTDYYSPSPRIIEIGPNRKS